MDIDFYVEVGKKEKMKFDFIHIGMNINSSHVATVKLERKIRNSKMKSRYQDALTLLIEIAFSVESAIKTSEHPHLKRCPLITTSKHPHFVRCLLITTLEHSHLKRCPLIKTFEHPQLMGCPLITTSKHPHFVRYLLLTTLERPHSMRCPLITTSEHPHLVRCCMIVTSDYLHTSSWRSQGNTPYSVNGC